MDDESRAQPAAPGDGGFADADRAVRVALLLDRRAACASLTIESIGIRGIASATPALLEKRMAEVWECLKPKS